MRKISRLFILAALMGFSAFLFGGCNPATDAERAYMEKRQNEAQVRSTVRQSLDGGTEERVAIQLVKDAPAPEEEGTTEAWLRATLDKLKGDVLFPRWQGYRRGREQYEVWFTYTFMRQDGGIEKKGYSWTVDVVLKIVNPPRALTPKELDMRTSRYFRSRVPAKKVELKQD